MWASGWQRLNEDINDQKSEKNRACFYGLVVFVMLIVIIGFVVPIMEKISDDVFIKTGIVKKSPTKCRDDSDCGQYGICYVNAGMNNEGWCSVFQIERGLSELITTREIPSNLPVDVASIQSLKNPLRKSVAYCEICKSAVNATIELRKSGASDEVIGSLLEMFCVVFYKSYEEICRREVHAGYLDTLLFIIDNKQDLTAERACSIWLQKYNCVDPGYKPWSIDIPAKRDVQQSNRVGKTSDNVTKVLHLTDFHYDPEYLAESLAVCDQPLCCQAESTKKSGGNAVKAGSWGDYHECDTPWKAVLDAIEEPKKRHTKIDYVYFTGDIVSHKIWSTSKTYNSDAITKVMQQFKDTYGSIPVFPVLGNHESHPASVFSSQNITQADTDVSTQWLLDLAAKEWLRWLPKETEATIKYGGYYNVLVKPGFRVIGLNSNYCYIANLWLIYKDNDPHGQLQWLVAQLDQAESNDEKVHILSHVPPGSNGECHKQWSHEYRRIIERFSEVVVAQFNGHTHEDELKVFYDTNNPEKVINVAYNGGSVTSYIGLNPDYRVYDVSSGNAKVLDFEEWYYNLTEANQNPNQPPNWQRLYRFKEAYGMEDMEPQSFHNLLQRMTNNPTLADQYYRFKVRDSAVKMEKGCLKECIIQNLCSITNVEFEESIQCKAAKNEIKSKYSLTN